MFPTMEEKRCLLDEEDYEFDFLFEATNNYEESHHNFYDRYINTSKKYPSKSIIRLTADCPLVMPELLDEMIKSFELSEVDYLSNALTETFPDGLDIEIFRSSSLFNLQRFKLNSQEKESVTLGIYTRPEIFSIEKFESKVYLGEERWTVDYPEDFDFVTKVFRYFQNRTREFNIEDVLNYIKLNPDHKNKKPSEFRNIALKSSFPLTSDTIK
jgi:spore coat polysaccharide biosynthesis protein SpsF (cytidylyltransferase family)